MTPLVILDSSHPLVRQNRCFEKSEIDALHGNSFYFQLQQEGKKRGFEFITADEYLTMSHSPFALCVTDMFSPYTEKVLEKGAFPAVCSSMESPIIAKKFYHHIKKYSGHFRYNIQFRGTQERFRDLKTDFHTMHYPVERLFPPLSDTTWKNKKYLTLINRNKRSLILDFKGLNAIKTLAKVAVFKWWQLTDPWMRSREIYVDRIKAIHYFSQYSDLHLYGEGWDDPVSGFSKKYHESARKAWKQTLPFREKNPTLNKYRFSLCFENCSFPGYITEKIFDCFHSGCIPVYFGAPDITDFVPKLCFIDYRDFKSFTQLDKFLREMSEETGKEYLDAAYSFLQSPECESFYQNVYIDTLLDLLENYKKEIEAGRIFK
ncbi:MAG: hypothetical protein HOE30_20605 [Deltaproteobacteria bacterium]|nr:hypothetical protein [Deltaproteobacteria bacterium]